MALRLKVPFGRQPVPEVAPPAAPAPVAETAAPPPAPLDTYVQGDALPVPDVLEKNSDSIWATWSDLVNEKPTPEAPPELELELLPNILQTEEPQKDPRETDFLDTIPATFSRDLSGIRKK